jgi:hypothetical protein
MKQDLHVIFVQVRLQAHNSVEILTKLKVCLPYMWESVIMLQLLFYLLILYSQRQEAEEVDIEDVTSMLKAEEELQGYTTKVCRQ